MRSLIVAGRTPPPLWTDGRGGLFPLTVELTPICSCSENPLLLSGLAGGVVGLRPDRYPLEGQTAPLGGAVLARGAVCPGRGWGSTSGAPSRHDAASRSAAAARRAAPVRSRLPLFWAGLGLLALASCGVPLAPVVRCVPDSILVGCR